MRIDVYPAPIEEKSVLRNMLELYQYDFSETEGWDLNEHGLFNYKYLDNYWSEAHRHPFLVRVDGLLAGFALVSTFERSDGRKTQMSEFFVMRKYRRKGVGEHVASQLFDRFPGRWELSELERNVEAQRFWRTIIGRLAGYTERSDRDTGRVIQQFRVP